LDLGSSQAIEAFSSYVRVVPLDLMLRGGQPAKDVPSLYFLEKALSIVHRFGIASGVEVQALLSSYTFSLLPQYPMESNLMHSVQAI